MRILKLSFIALLSLLILSLGSCKKKKEQTGPEPTQFEKVMTSKDTADVKGLIDEFFQYAKDKKFSEAAGMLCRNDNTGEDHKPEALDNEQMAKVRAMLESIPMVDYEIEYIKFNENIDNEVLCNVIIAKAEGDMPAVKTKMFFKPVRSMGQWYLCLMNSEYGDKGVVDPYKRDSMEKDYATKDSTVRKADFN